MNDTQFNNASRNPQRFFSDIFGRLAAVQDSDGSAWFRAAEVLEFLELDKSALRRVDAEDKRTGLAETANYKIAFVNEAGLYCLISHSRKPAARAFKSWVWHDVLPSIRRNGGYIVGQEKLHGEARQNLEREIKALAERVEKANAGKVKLQTLLVNEEDRVFDLMEKLRDAEHALAELRDEFSSVDKVEAHLAALKDQHAKRAAELAEAERRIKEERARRAVVRVTAIVDTDPLMMDGCGMICRRSEHLAAREGR